jgi:hypothetical protein
MQVEPLLSDQRAAAIALASQVTAAAHGPAAGPLPIAPLQALEASLQR